MKNIFRILFVVFCIFATKILLHAQWGQTNGLSGETVEALVVSGTNLFAGTSGDGVFLSTNNGTSWTQVNSGLANKNVYALAVSPNGAGDTNLFAGTYGGGVYLSTNNGLSWNGYDATFPYVKALSVSDTNIFVGSFSSGVCCFSESGGWRQDGLLYTHVNAFVVYDTNVFAGTLSGIFLSTN